MRRRVAPGDPGHLVHQHLPNRPVGGESPDSVEVVAVRVLGISRQAGGFDHLNHSPVIFRGGLTEFVNLPGVGLFVGRNPGEDGNRDGLCCLLRGHARVSRLYSKIQVFS